MMMSITLVSIVTLTLLFAGDNNIPLATFAFSRRALTAISLGHVVLVLTLGLGTIQGIRSYLSKQSSAGPPSVNKAL